MASTSRASRGREQLELPGGLPGPRRGRARRPRRVAAIATPASPHRRRHRLSAGSAGATRHVHSHRFPPGIVPGGSMDRARGRTSTKFQFRLGLRPCAHPGRTHEETAMKSHACLAGAARRRVPAARASGGHRPAATRRLSDREQHRRACGYGPRVPEWHARGRREARRARRAASSDWATPRPRPPACSASWHRSSRRRASRWPMS